MYYKQNKHIFSTVTKAITFRGVFFQLMKGIWSDKFCFCLNKFHQMLCDATVENNKKIHQQMKNMYLLAVLNN